MNYTNVIEYVTTIRDDIVKIDAAKFLIFS